MTEKKPTYIRPNANTNKKAPEPIVFPATDSTPKFTVVPSPEPETVPFPRNTISIETRLLAHALARVLYHIADASMHDIRIMGEAHLEKMIRAWLEED